MPTSEHRLNLGPSAGLGPGCIHTIERTTIRTRITNARDRLLRRPAPVDSTGPACTVVIHLVDPNDTEGRDGWSEYRKHFASREDALRDAKRKVKRLADSPARVELHTRTNGITHWPSGRHHIGFIDVERLS